MMPTSGVRVYTLVTSRVRVELGRFKTFSLVFVCASPLRFGLLFLLDWVNLNLLAQSGLIMQSTISFVSFPVLGLSEGDMPANVGDISGVSLSRNTEREVCFPVLQSKNFKSGLIFRFQSNGVRTSFEDAVLNKLDQLEKNILKFSALQDLLSTHAQKDHRLDSIEERLGEIAEAVCVKADNEDNEEYSFQKDARNRLKEKLKKALDQTSEASIAKMVSTNCSQAWQALCINP